MRMRNLLILAALPLAASACLDNGDYDKGEIELDPDQPGVEEPDPIDPYEGDNEIVLEAQEHFRTGLEFHSKVIYRTCTPNDGVCHNSKEYPDLRTPAAFVDAFDSPCNVQPGEYQSVYDGCEQAGDRLVLPGGFGDPPPMEIGWVEYIPGDGEEIDYDEDNPPDELSAGLHIQLSASVPTDRLSAYGSGEFTRKFVIDGSIEEQIYADYNTRWWVVGDGSHVVGQVANYQVDNVQDLIAAGIVEGDANRNGTYGATQGAPYPLLAPGSPEDSYLIGRMRGEMHGESLPGSRMPLANQPLTLPEMLAIFCLVEGFDPAADDAGLANYIDYKNCSYSEDPESLNLLGDGVTWESRVSKILEFNCGCHSGTEPAADLNLLEGEVYDRLFEPSIQEDSGMPLVTPGDPENSYLWLKLIDDDSIEGSQMPYNPLNGEGSLTEAELGDIETWIVNGAVEDE